MDYKADYQTALKELNSLKVAADATDAQRQAAAAKVADAYNWYSASIAPKGARVRRLPAAHFLARYIPA